MLELAIKGGKKYYGWMTFLTVIVGVGFLLYLKQLDFGLGITGLSRDASWGFYIANFTFLVGVAAGGVMVVLPYYLHDYKAFGKVTILGEFLAIASVLMCVTFILVDLGQPMRVLNVLLYPTFNSVLFWDFIVLNGYLFLNIVIGWNVLEAERNGVHYQKAETVDLYFDSLGHQHPYRHRLPLLRPAGQGLLDDRHFGPALFVISVCSRSGPADLMLPDHPACEQL
jgi:molybdopterin-containing oxidoreductase family membrane subunit